MGQSGARVLGGDVEYSEREHYGGHGPGHKVSCVSVVSVVFASGVKEMCTCGTKSICNPWSEKKTRDDT